MNPEIKRSVNLRLVPGASLRLILGIVLASACVLGLIGTTLTNTMRPRYCTRCHSMERSYQAWVNGVRCNAGCLECHTDTKTGVCLAKEIEDRTCVKATCHPQEKLFVKKEPYEDFGPFNHETHLKKWAYDQGLRCTACHAHQGGEKHFNIDKNSCYVCHFVRGEGVVEMVSLLDKPLWECSLCHDEIKKKIQIYEKEFDHASFEKPGVDCNSCHFDRTVHGSGTVDKDSCYQCHDSVPEDYSSVNDMHYDHMARHKVGCSPCHEEINHRMYRDTSETDEPDIFGEILAENPVYVEMMKGRGGKGVHGTPDPMYIATVSCSACHEDNLDEPINPEICDTCHDKGFETILEEQIEWVKTQMHTLEELLEIVRSSGQDVGEETLEKAQHNYDLIATDGSLGGHNIKYVKDLLEFSISSLEDIPGS
ncbi:MAG: hypothetical protein ACE5IC_04930 [Candidatus Brocadiales bacterium]